MSILGDELGDLKDDLGDSEDTVKEQPGPLVGNDLMLVSCKLNSIRTTIQNVLYLINNVGQADGTNLPQSLPAIADQCLLLAQQAYAEGQQANPNKTLIGDRVKTIDRIITVANGYAHRAGVT